MEPPIRQHLDTLKSSDAPVRYAAFSWLLDKTENTVDWSTEAFEELFALARDGDNHQRTIAVQLISNLAKSDTSNCVLNNIDKLIAVTHDEKFVTARHSLQSLWKIGIVNADLRKPLLRHLKKRFADSADEKNSTLIRFDIQEVLAKIYQAVKDHDVKTLALDLIATEPDPKYQKKYRAVWKSL